MSSSTETGAVSEVDTERLDQAADALVALRGDTQSADNSADEDTMSAARGLNRYTAGSSPEAGSWRTAGALVSMDVRWGQQVANLKEMLQDISDRLHATTGHYTRTEQQERFRMSLPPSVFG